MIVSNFGAVSPSGTQCPASGSWEAWCDCMFSDPAVNAKCKKQPLGPLSGAPWTFFGANARGIPFTGTLTVPSIEEITKNIPGMTTAANAQVEPYDPSIENAAVSKFPKYATYAGVAVLGLGLVALVSRKRK